MGKFQDKYRIPSARATWWDYGWDAAYFVTVCTRNRVYHLGQIQNNKMALSEIGKYAEQCWVEIPQHFPFVTLHEFVIMPNHVHGIIIINKSGKKNRNGDDNVDGGVDRTTVETQNFASLQPPTDPEPMHRPQPIQSSPKTRNRFGPQSQNLGSVIRGFKIGVTKNARSIHADFAWQSRYHDRIIRNHDEYQRIANYIVSNPENWKTDKFF